MKLLHRLKTLIRKTDMFYASDMLRYEKEGEYSTITGGIISAGILVAILVGFASMILDTLDLSVITTQASLIKQIDPTSATLTTAPEAHFMFGIEVWRLNLSDSKRYFDVNFYHQQESGGVIMNYTTISLQQCTQQHWSLYPELIKNFQLLQTSGWLCPHLDFSVNLKGKYTSSEYSNLLFMIDPCSNTTFPYDSCASPQQIDQLFLDNNYLYFTFYFMNPVINSDKKDYKSYYLQEKTFVIFGKNLGAEAYLSFADFTITTDNSVWPYSSEKVDTGVIVQDAITLRPFPRVSGTYVYFYIDKSPNSLIYNRQVQKISSVFSFIGGMISALSAVLFIVKIYNSLSFQLSIALEIFKPHKDSGLQKSSLKMNLFNFFRYYFFVLTKEIGKPLENKSLRFMNECQQEILSQLDIKQLIKRVIFIQHCLGFVFQDYQLQGLQIKKPTSPQQIRKIRLKCESIEFSEDIGEIKETESDISSQQSAYQMKIKLESISLKKDENLQRGLEVGRQRNSKIITIHKQGKQRQLRVIDIGSEDLSAFNDLSDPIVRSKLIFELKKEENMSNLKKDAALGNLTSKKIWNFVEQDHQF